MASVWTSEFYGFTETLRLLRAQFSKMELGISKYLMKEVQPRFVLIDFVHFE